VEKNFLKLTLSLIIITFSLFNELIANDCVLKINELFQQSSISSTTQYLNKENIDYFLMLLEKNKSSGKSSKEMVIFEEGIDFTGKQIVYPTAMASDEMMNFLKVLQYNDYLNDSSVTEAAKEITLIIQKMNGGTGSSLKRAKYLANTLGISEKDVIHGAKGTDLFIKIDGELVSFAEAQLIQAYLTAHNGSFKSIITNDLVGPETKKSLQHIWNSPSYFDKSKTWEELFNSDQFIHKGKTTFQDHLPTLDSDGNITTNRKAPGGHAYFAFNALLDAIDPNTSKNIKSSILAIGNGEDLSSVPDNVMIGMMKKEKLGIVMVTTKKMPTDIKNGGQIAIAKDGDFTFATIMEKAQAEWANQLKLFQSLGIDIGIRDAMFNTNLTLFNYEVLIPKLQKLLKDVGGREEFLKIISPDLIKNNKSQIDLDGIGRTYTQLEGAMGSVILNLDKEWRHRYGEPLVSFINVDDKLRTRFFAPLKSAFDFLIQVFSDRFVLKKESMQFVNTRPGILPSIKIDSYYNELAHVLEDFKGVKIKYLEDLQIEGIVKLNSFTLKGNVKIISKNKNEKIDLLKIINNKQNIDFKLEHLTEIENGSYVLENISWVINENGKLEILYQL